MKTRGSLFLVCLFVAVSMFAGEAATTNGVQCSFTGDTMNARKIKSDNRCEDCTKDCGS